ncbi:hypothetical protein JCM8097_006689 [Rhodosporidiobolus ruineniae]
MLSLTRTALRGSLALSRPRLAPAAPFSTSSLLLASLRPAPRARDLKPAQRQAQKNQKEHQPRDKDSYILAQQVRDLVTSSSSIPQALDFVRSAPKHATNVVVWNTLLQAIFKLSPRKLTQGPVTLQEGWRINKAFDVWMEMKRRKLTPSARSYATFMAGVARAARTVELKLAGGPAKSDKGEDGLGPEARAKVDAVHKQWLAHCERVLEAHEAAEEAAGVASSGRGGKAAKGKKKASSFSSYSLSGLAAELAEDDHVRSEEDDRFDGKDDTVADLAVTVTNNYLSFLSSSLAAAIATKPAYAPPLLGQILTVFEAIPTPPKPGQPENPLAKNGVSFLNIFTALRHALATGHTQPALFATAEPGNAADRAPTFPPPAALLETALTLYSDLLASPPADSRRRFPDPRFPPQISPTLATVVLGLFLAPPNSSTTLPAPLWIRAVELAQSSFGFVPPSRLADLTPPYPPSLENPHCGPLDAQALGTALRVVGFAGRPSWAASWWAQARDYPARFGIEEEGEKGWEAVATRENAEVVIKAAGASGDIAGIEELLAYLSSSPSNPPTVSTFALALTSLHRIGTPEALTAALRVWDALLLHSASAGAQSKATKMGEGRGAVPRKEHANAAAALLRLAIGLRDRTQIWRVLKAVSGPFPSPSPTSSGADDSLSSHSDAPALSTSSTSATVSSFSPALFPYSSAAGLRPADLNLSHTLLTALERLLRAPVDKFSFSTALSSVEGGMKKGEEVRREMERWEGRLRGAVESEGGRAERGEMALRRQALLLRDAAREKRRESGTPLARAAGREGAPRRPVREREERGPRGERDEGGLTHTPRRREWWAARQNEWAAQRAEREVFGRDARGRLPPSFSSSSASSSSEAPRPGGPHAAAFVRWQRQNHPPQDHREEGRERDRGKLPREAFGRRLRREGPPPRGGRRDERDERGGRDRRDARDGRDGRDGREERAREPRWKREGGGREGREERAPRWKRESGGREEREPRWKREGGGKREEKGGSRQRSWADEE